MTQGVYQFRFRAGVDLREAEMSLLLAMLAAEGIHGQSRVRLDAAYAVGEALRTIVVDGFTEVGQDIVGIFTAFITRELGGDAFHVRRFGKEEQS
jgi:hypothetical protein